MTYRKVGGLHHWRIGRLGGSFYLKRLSTMAEVERQMRHDHYAWVLSRTLPITVGIWTTVLM